MPSSTACGSTGTKGRGHDEQKDLEQEYDIVVIGGGTAGPMAAIKAKERNRELRVLLVDKANVKRSGAISMGMDGLNNAIIPGHSTPEQYTKEITIANDGIVNQAAVYAYATHSFETIEQLDRWGEVREGRNRRLRSEEGPPHGRLCAADAGRA